MPTPTITQGDSPEQIAAAVKNVQSIFDRVSPAIKGKPSEPLPPQEPVQKTQETPAAAVEPPKEPSTEPVKPVETPSQKPADDSQKLPSFLQEALKTEPVKTKTQPYLTLCLIRLHFPTGKTLQCRLRLLRDLIQVN